MINPVEKLGEEKITKILQNKQLAMLKEVKRIFDKNNIPFFLACGTALGCARHQGFIPWDDDVDIYVWGKDYSRIKMALENDPSGTLKFHDYSIKESYPYWFPKIIATDTVLIEKSLNQLDYSCGVYIDVFPLFYASDNRFIRIFQESLRYFWYVLLRAYFSESFSSGIRKFMKFFSKSMINPRKIQARLEKTYQTKKKHGQYVVDPGIFHKDALIDSNLFNNKIDMKFEDSQMPMPERYKDYLTHYYGDYMKLPEEKDRVSRHHIAKLEIDSVLELKD